MTLIKSISGIRGTIGGKAGEGLNPLDIVKFTSAYATLIRKTCTVKSNKIVVGLGVSKEWLLTGRGNVFYMMPPQHSKAVSLPASAIHSDVRQGAKVYDVDVTAGNMGRSMMFSNDRLIGAIDVPFISPDSSIVRVSGDSMQPVICCGDMVAIREVRNLDLIFWGQIYVVLLDDYRMVKYVRKHQDPSMVILRSANKEYDDIEVRKSDIRDLFVVEHIIRFDSRM